ncbi:MAG: ABC transporter substrate-binding protein [Rubrobacteraceae bacterium]
MPELRAVLVTPLSGPLARFGREGEAALSLWANHAADLPPEWTGVNLDVYDANPDPTSATLAATASRPDVLFGPYGSSPTLAAADATSRVVWNHGGATSALSRPDFPHVINVLSPASSYPEGALRAVRAADADASTVCILHAETGFARDIASGARRAAAELGFRTRVVSYEPGCAPETIAPETDILLSAAGFEDEVEAARTTLPGGWKAAAFVGAGVEDVLAPVADLREGLLGPAQWTPSTAPEPDEGPDAKWFVKKFREDAGSEPSYPAAQAFAAGILSARCVRDGGVEDAAQLEAARNLECTTLYGRFRLDAETGLQSGHEVLIVQWQNGVRRVVWPFERAESGLVYPLPGG